MEKLATKSDLQEMYSRIRPYLGGSADAGFTPVGTIISVMGVNAPANYLACNGQVVNIADYPELANYFLQQFGSKNKFGGNGTTTFGIPDLRGEFLRGTGTNSHTNQGSGANVGTHQDATTFPNMASDSANTYITATTSFSGSIANADYTQNTTGTRYVRQLTVRSTDSQASPANSPHSVRPTNTSVLFCIATKNIYLNPANDYSTSEKVVGTWLNEEPIYQKTVLLNGGTVDANNDYYQTLLTGVALLLDYNGYYLFDNGQKECINVTTGSRASSIFWYSRCYIPPSPNDTEIRFFLRRGDGNSMSITGGYITLQYIKL